MAFQITGFRVFVGSSAAEEGLRTQIKSELGKINNRICQDRIFLHVIDYRDLFLDGIPIQRGITPKIADSDLVILIFGSRVGSGLAEEYELAVELYRKSQITNFMFFFIVPPDDLLKNPSPELLQLLKFKERVIAEGVPYADVQDPEELIIRVHQHVGDWLEREKEIVTGLREFLDDAFYSQMHIRALPYSDAMIRLGKLPYEDPRVAEEAKRAHAQYVRATDIEHLLSTLTQQDCYLIARLLHHSILESDPAPCHQREFINPIHQYLSAMIREGPTDEYRRATDNLTRWLNSYRTVPEIARNFAAFELGMIRARGAAQALTAAVTNPHEQPSVRHYSAMALAMIQQRQNLKALFNAYRAETHGPLKNQIAQSVLCITSRAT